jgi:hypothetical protein
MRNVFILACAAIVLGTLSGCTGSSTTATNTALVSVAATGVPCALAVQTAVADATGIPAKVAAAASVAVTAPACTALDSATLALITAAQGAVVAAPVAP